MARCCHRAFLEVKLKKPVEFQGDLQNVDLALTRFRAGHTQVFLSDSNHLEKLYILVS